MKSLLWPFLAVSFCFSLFSCSNPEGFAYSGDENLRELALAYDSKTNWTESIESDVLTNPVERPNGVSSSIYLSPAVMAAVSEDSYAPVYPSIHGFASLDVSTMDIDALSFLKSFLARICSGEAPESMVISTQMHTLSFFYYDINQLIGDVDFTQAVIGKPFDGSDFYQCPVRLYFTRKNSSPETEYFHPYVDVFVYVRLYSNDWKCCKIEFMGLEDKDGRGN